MKELASKAWTAFVTTKAAAAWLLVFHTYAIELDGVTVSAINVHWSANATNPIAPQGPGADCSRDSLPPQCH